MMMNLLVRIISVAIGKRIVMSSVCMVGPGLFHDIIQEAKNMSIEERAELLENSKALAQVHGDAAATGQTEVTVLYGQFHTCF